MHMGGINRVILMGFFRNILAPNVEASKNLITHKETAFSVDILKYKESLKLKKNLCLSLQKEISLLEQLAQFELGRFLLVNKGLNGYWISYIIIHGLQKDDLHPLEKWILLEAPAVKATQERFNIFQQVLKGNLRPKVKVASIPCGLMDDLLSLEYSDIKEVILEGIDLDSQSLSLAQEKAKKYGVANVSFCQKDA